jgi:23S rRNA (adenine2503-C2)-methyltransferase
MKVIESHGREDLAVVYVARTGSGHLVEYVEALVPPFPREEKWVTILSTLYGCPVGCLMCDSGLHYAGRVSEDDILAQIDDLVRRRFPGGEVATGKWKIHFARMGDPSFNPAVVGVLERLPARYRCPGLTPSISTVAPLGTDGFFDALLDLRERVYPEGRFQLQFSIHTTDTAARDELIPVRKRDFGWIARYGEAWYASRRGRKVTLNFAASTRYPVDPSVVAETFDPQVFLIKITPLNPSLSTAANGLESLVALEEDAPRNRELVRAFESFGYDTVLSIGEPEENAIRSNCGLRVLEVVEAQGRVVGRRGATARIP